jgi:hypothetical protein
VTPAPFVLTQLKKMMMFVVLHVATPSMLHALTHGSQAVVHVAPSVKLIIMCQKFAWKVLMEGLIPIV